VRELVFDLIVHFLLFALGFAFLIFHEQIHNRLDGVLERLRPLIGERWTGWLRVGWAWSTLLILIVGGVTILLGALALLLIDILELLRVALWGGW